MTRFGQVNFLSLTKGEETYVVVWDDESYGEMLLELAAMACDPELSFNAYDCASMTQIAPHAEVEL